MDESGCLFDRSHLPYTRPNYCYQHLPLFPRPTCLPALAPTAVAHLVAATAVALPAA